MALEFLVNLYDSGIGYSCLNTARCALSAVIIPVNKVTFGAHPLVVRFMKGVYNERVPVPRYQEIWDPQIVLRYLAGLASVETLSLKDLTLKLVMLMVLVSAQRGQTLQFLSLSNMTVRTDAYTFVIDKVVKQSRPGNAQPVIKFKVYPVNRQLCVLHTRKEYLTRTESIRSTETHLLISYMKPHKAVSRETIRRWILTVLIRAGVDTTRYKAHSTRAASASAAKRNAASLDMIMKAAGWKSSDTFAKFYDKPVEKQDKAYADLVLDS